MKKLFSLLFICICALSMAQAQQKPQFAWAKDIGSTSDDIGYDIAVDNNGNSYTIGAFEGTVDFDQGTGIANLTSKGLKDICITKLNSAGNFIWAKQIGSFSADNGYSIWLDGTGNIYAGGNFSGTVDFDPGAGTTNLSSAGGMDMFILKLDVNGQFKWARSMGNASNQGGLKITTDPDGNVCIAGGFDGSLDFDPGAGTCVLNATEFDIFVAKLDADGDFIWARKMGGIWSDGASSITTDASGNIYTTGSFLDKVDFDPGAGTYYLNCDKESDVFILKLDAAGNFGWARSLSGKSFDGGCSIAIDGNGDIYIGGQFSVEVDFDPDTSSTFFMTGAGQIDLFVLKLDAGGNFIWARNMGGLGWDLGRDIALDNSGNVYFTGSFQGVVDFDPDPSTTFNLNSGSWNAIYILKLDNSGNFVWAQKMGSAVIQTEHYGRSIALDGSGNIYVTGTLQASVDFDPGPKTFNLQSGGGTDIFICKLYKDSISNIPSLQNIGLQPNPTSGKLNIVVSNPTSDNRIELYNSLGVLILTKTDLSTYNTIELGDEANGLYWVRVMSADEVVSTMTIIKQ